MNFHFTTNHMQNFPFPAYREKGNPQWTPKESEMKGCKILGIQTESFAVHEAYLRQNGFTLYY